MTGQTTWSGGTLTGTGSLEAMAGLKFGSSNATTLALAGGFSLINDAAARGLTGALTLQVSDGSTITNKSGATLTFVSTTSASIVNNGGSPSGGTLINQGTVDLSAFDSSTATIGIPITNSGTIRSSYGTLSISAGGTFSGTSIFDSANGNIAFPAGSASIPSGATFSGAGKYLVNGGTVAFGGTFSATGLLRIDSGQINFNVPATLRSLLITGGTLGGTGAVVVNNATTWTGGTMTGAGSTEAKGGLTLGSNSGGVASQLALTSGRSLINDAAGTTGTSGFGFSLVGDYTSSITNASGATLTLGSSSSITNLSSFGNAGTVTIGSGSTLAAASYTQSAGTTTLNGGALTASTTAAINGGTLSGTGTITGNVTNAGQVLPGGAGTAGVLNIVGNYSQTSAGALTLDIGGSTSGSQYDLLAISGAATLAGTLNVNRLNSYTPSPSTAFLPLTFASKTGDFSTTSGLLFGTVQLYSSYSGTGLNIVANASPTVPPVTSTITSNGSSSFSLSASDVETLASSLTFTITSLPAGTLYKAGVPVTLGQTFTGSPVGFTYQAPSVVLGNFTDSFSFSVADLGGGLTTSTASLSLANPAPGEAIIFGAAGDNTILASNNGGNLQVTLNGVVNNTSIPVNSITQLDVVGGGGVNTFAISGLSLNASLSAGSFTVAGTSGADTFNVNSSNSVGFNGATITATSPLTINGLGGNDTFNILAPNVGATLIAGGGNDSFVLASGASITTPINGGGGTNTINETAVTTPVTLNVAASTVTGLSSPFANIQSVIGGSSTGNTVKGPVAASTFNITGANAGNVGGIAFGGFGNLTGGAASNRFVFNNGGTLSGSIIGGGGAFSRIDESAYTTKVSTNLATNQVTGVGGTFSNIQSIIGSATAYGTLTGPATGSTYNITTSNTIVVGAVTLANYSDIVAGAGNDVFKFSAGGLLAGSINGGGGSNTADLSSYTGPTDLNIPTSHIAGFSTYSNVQRFIGSSTSVNTVIGPNTSTVFNITGTNTGNVAGLNFVGFGSLRGGYSPNQFVFSDGASLTGSLNGGTSSFNIIDESAYTTKVSANLNTRTLTGLGGTFTGVAKILGSSTVFGSLTGPSANSSYNIVAANIVVVAGVRFNNFSDITGGAGNDSFSFSSGGLLAGSINGGGGSNTVDMSAYTGSTNLNLSLSHISGFSTYGNIQTFIGSATSANTVIGPNTSSVFNITGTNTGNVSGVNFVGFGNLQGGLGNDVFAFGDGVSITGSINGGPGRNWVDYNAYSTGVNVDITTGVGTGVGTTIRNIQNLRGGSGNDTLTGNSAGNILIGGLGDDTLNAGSGRNILIGGGGSDTINGGTLDDILIGGTTSYDNNFVAIDSILAEWRSSNSYATRVSLIKNGGGLNGGNTLALGTTVIDDNAVDSLIGNGGTDWYFIGTGDTGDNQAGEQVN